MAVDNLDGGHDGFTAVFLASTLKRIFIPSARLLRAHGLVTRVRAVQSTLSVIARRHDTRQVCMPLSVEIIANDSFSPSLSIVTFEAYSQNFCGNDMIFDRCRSFS
jgi:hypothetical protein